MTLTGTQPVVHTIALQGKANRKSVQADKGLHLSIRTFTNTETKLHVGYRTDAPLAIKTYKTFGDKHSNTHSHTHIQNH